MQRMSEKRRIASVILLEPGFIFIAFFLLIGTRLASAYALSITVADHESELKEQGFAVVTNDPYN